MRPSDFPKEVADTVDDDQGGGGVLAQLAVCGDGWIRSARHEERERVLERQRRRGRRGLLQPGVRVRQGGQPDADAPGGQRRGHGA